MNTALIMTFVYLVVTVGISLFAAQRQKKNAGSSEFMVAKRSLGVGLLIPLLFSELIAGAGTVGNAASAFKGGLSSVWVDWGMVLGCFLFLIVAGKFYRAMSSEKGVMSVPEAYRHIFDARSRMVLLFIIFIVYGILFSNQPVAAASIVSQMIGVDKVLLTWIITAIFILVTILGGMKGIAWMNVVHAALMVVGLGIVAVMSINSVGGIANMQAVLPATYFSVTQPNIPTTIANAAGTAISFLAAATIAGVSFSAKNLKSFKWAAIVTAIVIVPFAVCPAFIGMAAKIAMPGVNPNFALYAMANSFGSGYSGLVSMAVIAAIWSTAPALLLIAATTLTRDFYVLRKPDATDKQQLRFTKISIIVIGVVFTFFGLQATSILDSIFGAFQIRSVVGIVLGVALFWPRVTKNAAFWSMLCGGVVAAVWFILKNPFGISSLWPAALVTLVILIPMTLASKEKVSPGYKMYKEAIEAAKSKGSL